MNIYEFRELLRKKPVFNLSEASFILKKPNRITKIYLYRMVKKGIINRVMKGLYSTTKDPYVIASNILPNSYISLSSALYIRGLITQTIRRVEVIVPRRIKAPSWIIPHVVNKEMIFGYERIRWNDYYINIAYPEKAVLDFKYLKRVNPYKEVEKTLNKKRLKEFCKRMRLKC